MKKRILSLVILSFMLIFSGCSTNAGKTEVYKRPEVKTASEAIELLKQGNERFVSGKRANLDLGEEKRKELEKGQKPFAVIVGCSDSRVTSNIIFDQGLGDLFEVKIAGNVVDENALGSIEYAVEHLNTPLVVVLGHQHCGAVKATVEAVESKHEIEGNIASLVEKIKPSVEGAKAKNLQGEELVEEAVNENVDNVIEDLEKSAIIKEKIEKGELKVVAAKYYLDSGKIEWKK